MSESLEAEHMYSTMVQRNSYGKNANKKKFTFTFACECGVLGRLSNSERAAASFTTFPLMRWLPAKTTALSQC